MSSHHQNVHSLCPQVQMDKTQLWEFTFIVLLLFVFFIYLFFIYSFKLFQKYLGGLVWWWSCEGCSALQERERKY